MGTKQVKRILIVEEGLRDVSGHWYEYIKAVADINRSEGYDVVVAANQDVTDEVADNLCVVPLFERTSWDGVYYHRYAIRRYWGVFRHSRYVRNVMSRYFESSESFTCVFVPTAVVFHLIAWRLLASRYAGGAFSRLVLFVRNNAGAYPDGVTEPVFKRSTIVLKLVLKSFVRLVNNNTVCFATDSERLAAEYKKLCALEFEVFPSPRIATARTRTDPGSPMVFSCLGPARLEKGIDILQEAIRLLQVEGNSVDLHFVIQWDQAIRDAAGKLIEPFHDLVHSRGVTFLRSGLSSEEYSSRLERTDCMVLPYRWESYYARISGVAVEAATAGIPVIYTAGTWVEDMVSRYGAGVGTRNENPRDLADKIRQVAGDIRKFKAEAAARADVARSHHSPERFMRCLWGRDLHTGTAASSPAPAAATGTSTRGT